jgi:hypothetical protein
MVLGGVAPRPIPSFNRPPGKHSVRIELVDANHGVVDKGTVTFEVPEKGASGAGAPARKP